MPPRSPSTKASSRVEPREVEVVGRLVEQHEVEAAEQQCSERGPRRLAAGQRGHERVGAHVEAQLREHRRDAVVEVGGAAGEPVVERDGIPLVGLRVVATECRGRDLHRHRRGRGAGAAADVVGDGLTGHALVLLGQPPDEGVGGCRRHGARERFVLARKQPEQGRLAGAVGADDPDDVTRGDCQVEVLEEGPVGVAAGEVLGHEGRAHGASLGGPGASPATVTAGAR